jgi:hypothetical protein
MRQGCSSSLAGSGTYRVMILNSKPRTLFQLAKCSTRLVNHIHHFGNDIRLVYLTVSPRVSSYVQARDLTKVMVAYMIVAGFASATDYREEARFKVSPKLRSCLPSFAAAGYRGGQQGVGNFHFLAGASSRERERMGAAVVELLILHCELVKQDIIWCVD